jgi:hypothetical protein
MKKLIMSALLAASAVSAQSTHTVTAPGGNEDEVISHAEDPDSGDSSHLAVRRREEGKVSQAKGRFRRQTEEGFCTMILEVGNG